MSSRNRLLLAAAMACLGGGSALAQGWQVGAGGGLVNAVERHLHLDEFGHHDVNVWASVETEDHVVLRGMFGTLRVDGTNAGQPATVDGAVGAALPDLAERINYGTLSVSYLYFEGTYTSGVFAGIGGYRIEPDATTPGLEGFRDARQTVFGWHVGVDGDAKVSSRLSILGRLTLHKIKSNVGRSILTANGGLAYRF